MRANVYNLRNAAREELKRQTAAEGLLSERFPDVASIVVKMNYTRGGAPWLLRTLNFLPGSYAYFRVSCLGEGCDDGGLDLTRVMHRMIRSRERTAKGELSCFNKSAALPHPNVDYEVVITYN